MIEEVQLGGVTALIGARGGKYPSGNSVWVDDDISLIVDPSLDLSTSEEVGPRAVDIIVNSHAHEDHFVGNVRYPGARLLLHRADAVAMSSLDALMASYGLSGSAEDEWRKILVDTFNFRPRDDSCEVSDGEVLDLGRNKVHFLHTPGHTPGHLCLLFEPDSVLFTGDLDLTPFGPYYADAEASLDDTIASLERLRDLDGVSSFVSFHEAGVGHGDLRAAVERYMAVLWERDAKLLDFTRRPRSLDEIAGHYIVYGKKYDHIPWQNDAEKAMMRQHAERLIRQEQLRVEDGLFLAV